MRNSKGVTLVEIMITVAILFFLSGAVVSVFLVADKIWQVDLGLVELQQKGRAALLAITRELRQSNSSSITITNGGAKIEFDIPDAFYVPTTITYDLTGGRIVREHPLGTLRVVTSDANSLSFCCWNGGVCDSNCSGASLLEVGLELNQTVRGAPLSFSLRQKVRLRNE